MLLLAAACSALSSLATSPSTPQLAVCQVPKLPWTAEPALSRAGDVRLVLQDGTTLTAHSLYLQHASDVFSSALACSGRTQADAAGPGSDLEDAHPSPEAESRLVQSASVSSKRHRAMQSLPLPGTSREQALLLLHSLYSRTPESWAASLDPADLAELARVSHRFGCSASLQLADSSLVKLAKAQADSSEQAWVSVHTAPAQLKLARRLNLPRFEAYLGHFVGHHLNEVDLDFWTPRLLPYCEVLVSISRPQPDACLYGESTSTSQPTRSILAWSGGAFSRFGEVSELFIAMSDQHMLQHGSYRMQQEQAAAACAFTKLQYRYILAQYGLQTVGWHQRAMAHLPFVEPV